MIGGNVALGSGTGVCASADGEAETSSSGDRPRTRRETIMATRATRTAAKVNRLRADRPPMRRPRAPTRAAHLVRSTEATLTPPLLSPISLVFRSSGTWGAVAQRLVRIGARETGR